MKSKQLLRFYFSADKLNRALDNLISSVALNSSVSVTKGTEKILKIIDAKRELHKLYLHLDGIIFSFTEEERAVLRCYGLLRVGIRKLKSDCAREIKRVTIKFTRRLRFMSRFDGAIKLVKEYYCLM